MHAGEPAVGVRRPLSIQLGKIMAIKDLAAKAAKVARLAGATVTGDPALIARLKGEHAEVSSLMASILERRDASDVADIRERQRVFELIRENLMAHAKAEETVVYPAFERADGQELVDEVEHSFDDHHRIETLLEELHIDDPGTVAWMTKLEQLHTIVSAHVHEEENVIFPRARQALSDEQFKDLDTRYLIAEAEVKEQVHAELASQQR
jgi:hemerythrin superfamily protein